ncbi:MAG: hypothetical protein AB7D33_12805, partial [Sphingobium sp.]
WCVGHCEIGLALTDFRNLEASGAGAAAHMSLHHTDNVKEPANSTKQTPCPAISTGGHSSCYVGDQTQRKPEGFTASVRGHICPTSTTVKHLLQISAEILLSHHAKLKKYCEIIYLIMIRISPA